MVKNRKKKNVIENFFCQFRTSELSLNADPFPPAILKPRPFWSLIRVQLMTCFFVSKFSNGSGIFLLYKTEKNRKHENDVQPRTYEKNTATDRTLDNTFATLLYAELLLYSWPEESAEFCEAALAALLVFELKLEHAESGKARNVGVEVAEIDES